MDQRQAELAQTLKDLGLWRGLAPDEAESEQKRVAEGGYPFGLPGEPGETWFFIDGEEMAEGMISRQLSRLAPALHAHGVDLHIETVNRPARVEAGDYTISINGRICVMWSPGDWVGGYGSWETATVRPLAIINDLLAEAGSTDRLFTLGAGGNDGVMWLIDPRIVAAVAANHSFAGRDIPRLPTALVSRA